MKDYLLYLGVGLIFTHELDAMTNNEWSVLPLTSWLPDEYSRIVFVLIHIPLFAIVVALLASQNHNTRNKAQLGIAIFLIVHGVLHVLFMAHEKYEFESLLSNILIFGAAICGASQIFVSRR